MKFALGMLMFMTLAAISFVNARQEPLATVDTVDVSRYMGRWYAVASIPTTFERGCAQGTTAFYELLPNGRVAVTNTCYDAVGQASSVKGRAWIPDASEPGKLKVSFVRFLGISLFAADYWIVDLAPDYSYAAVGHPERAFGWILSRTPTLPDDVLDGIYARLEAMGYRRGQFVSIDQTIHLSKRLPAGG